MSEIDLRAAMTGLASDLRVAMIGLASDLRVAMTGLASDLRVAMIGLRLRAVGMCLCIKTIKSHSLRRALHLTFASGYLPA
jgi:hypothetical protein